MPKVWRRDNFILHALIATVVVFQLLSILLANNLESSLHAVFIHRAIVFHKYDGLAVFVIAVVFLLDQFFQSGRKILAWFPWLTLKGWRQIGADLAVLCRGKLPYHRASGGLAGTIHGFGMLLVLGLSSVGTSFLLCQRLGYHQLAEKLIGLHIEFAFLIWWYLAGHVVMAFLHRVVDKKYIVESD